LERSNAGRGHSSGQARSVAPSLGIYSFPRLFPTLDQNYQNLRPMAGVNNNIHEQMAENSLQPEYAPSHQDGQFALVTGEDQVSMD
ncbi:hypothetical protein A2U01_0085412, partial [Trifolium medium]|nr:hypothetical protein [Trifolium medium]